KGKLLQPTKRETSLQCVTCDDVGKVAVKAFEDPETYIYQTITLASEELTTQQVADLFSADLNILVASKKVIWTVTRLIMGKEVYRMFNWFNKGNKMAGMEQIYHFRETQEPLRLKQWIGHHFKDDHPAQA